MYLSSPSSYYGIRLRSYGSGARPCVAGVRAISRDVAFKPEAISCTEYDELAALRKAQAWGTPIFQPAHPRYSQAIARLNELEAKELGSLQT